MNRIVHLVQSFTGFVVGVVIVVVKEDVSSLFVFFSFVGESNFGSLFFFSTYYQL